MKDTINILFKFVKTNFNLKFYLVSMLIVISVLSFTYTIILKWDISLLSILLLPVTYTIGYISGKLIIYSIITNKKIKLMKKLIQLEYVIEFQDDITIDLQSIRNLIIDYHDKSYSYLSEYARKFLMSLDLFIIDLDNMDNKILAINRIGYFTYIYVIVNFILGDVDFMYMTEGTYKKYNKKLNDISNNFPSKGVK